MKRPTTKRKLAFEPLESKCAPSTVLLACAPLDDEFHAAFEQDGQSISAPDATLVKVDVSSNWQFQISTTDLLNFVQDNTNNSSTASTWIARPTAEQCRSADEMMKLGDQDLRALVISDSLQVA